MNFSVGVYELFGYTVPGSLYLAILAYAAERLEWPGLDQLGSVDETLVIVGVILAAFLLGTVLAPLGQIVERLFSSRAPTRERAIAEFLDNNPGQKGQSFLELSHYTLLAGLRQYSPDAAANTDRFRATSHMLRSSSVALGLAAALALVEAAVGPESGKAIVSALVLLAVAGAAIVQSGRLGLWARTSALEAASWLPATGTVVKASTTGELGSS